MSRRAAWVFTGVACGLGVGVLGVVGKFAAGAGLVLVAQPASEGTPRLPFTPGPKPVRQLDRTLREIAERFGAARSEWVMMELEYAGAASGVTIDRPQGQGKYLRKIVGIAK